MCYTILQKKTVDGSRTKTCFLIHIICVCMCGENVNHSHIDFFLRTIPKAGSVRWGAVIWKFEIAWGLFFLFKKFKSRTYFIGTDKGKLDRKKCTRTWVIIFIQLNCDSLSPCQMRYKSKWRKEKFLPCGFLVAWSTHSPKEQQKSVKKYELPFNAVHFSSVQRAHSDVKFWCGLNCQVNNGPIISSVMMKKLSHLMNWISFFPTYIRLPSKQLPHHCWQWHRYRHRHRRHRGNASNNNVLRCAVLCFVLSFSFACTPQGARIMNEQAAIAILHANCKYIEFAFDWPFDACCMPCKSSDINDRDSKKAPN